MRCLARPLLAVLLALLVARPAAAFDLASLPLDCTGNELCVIQNYFDRDPGPGARDYTCGFLTYNGHEGTDFRVSRADMERGVPVLAVADGVVRNVRDGEPEGDIAVRGKAAVRGREAGNAVALVHEGGFESQYSHLKRGSIRVKRGDRVRAGQVLGLVGLSGMTEFPHLELALRFQGRPFCPFAGLDAAPGCNAAPAPLWDQSRLAVAPLAYQATGLLRAGFLAAAPDTVNAFLDGPLLSDGRSDPAALLFCCALFGTRSGDRLAIRVLGPGGAVLAQSSRSLDRNQAQSMYFVGSRRNGPWPAGTYRGEFLLQRAGSAGVQEVLRLTRDLSLP